jgi:hypothetical protein
MKDKNVQILVIKFISETVIDNEICLHTTRKS